ncbi:glycosyl hydrolase [Paenibacillus sp. FSL H8-0034]|uniref:glycosyl hydrolase n=1 Tax=Paenibacillus sp. FSL H8-0034 TaxID=2954671 RepID=UPI0030F64844
MFDMQRFKQPAAADRIHPFWFWNGEMEDGQIQYQIDEMADKGLGGVFICARQGLKIPYLSEAWFQKVRVAVEAAEKRGLNVWLYDEYPYPSGIAGGEVTLEHPEAKHYTLTHTTQRALGGEHLSLELPWARIVYAKAVPITADGRRNWNEAIPIRDSIGNFQADSIFQKTGLTAYNQKRFFTYRTIQKLDWTAPDGEWEVFIAQEKEIEDFKYYGTFVDPCNREAMATFIRLTHEKYAKYLGEFFGTTIKGMFTDEIGLLGSIPWSPQLAGFFLERNGYDLLEHLHALLDPEAEGAAKIRYDYYQAVHLLLRESYHKQVHDWCEQHGLEYVAEVPSVRHTTQLFSHVPAGDTAHEKLGRSLEWILTHRAFEFRSSAKMVSSLARQLGRERNLIECFHSVGWSMTLQDARWMIDRMAAQGTNFFNFHAFFYTVDGLTQHDAPPSQFLQNPYWAHFRKLGDYTGRISYVMTSGEAVISIAVLEPITSLWARMGNPFHGFSHGGTDTAEEQRLSSLKAWWVRILYQLSLEGRDFDHLDPELLATAEISSGTIKLGNARYSTLVLPPLTNLESGAWKSIQTFLQQGGKVISMGQLPYEAIDSSTSDLFEITAAFGLTGGVKASFWEQNSMGSSESAASLYQEHDSIDGELQDWYKGEHNAYHLPFKASADEQQVLKPFTELLDKLDPMAVRLQPACGEWGLMLQTRLVEENKALVFISNQESIQRQVELQIESHLWGKQTIAAESYSLEFRELSLDTGEAVDLQGKYAQVGTSWGLPLSIAPFASRLIEVVRTDSGNASLSQQEFDSAKPWKWTLDASNVWNMSAQQANVLRLDTFRLTLSDAAASADSFSTIGADVGVKTFIDQCADLAETSALPVMMQQTFGTPMEVSLAYPLQARYSVEFVVKQLPEQVEMLMDDSAIAGSAIIRINGHVLDNHNFKAVFVYDHMNRSQEITSLLQEGMNLLTVDIEIGQDSDGIVDALYVTGPFEVHFDEANRAVLSGPEVHKLPLQAGPYEGYPYYAGVFSFTQHVEVTPSTDAASFELTFAGWDPHFHDCAEVLVNGTSLGVCTWSPYSWEGPATLLREADNHIEVKVTNTLIGLLEGKYFDYEEHAVKLISQRKG